MVNNSNKTAKRSKTVTKAQRTSTKVQKTVNTVEQTVTNGKKWSILVKNGQQWSKTVNKDGQKRLKIEESRTFLGAMFSDC